MYEHEIDVVKLLQQLRFIRHFTRNSLASLPSRRRLELNKAMEKSMFRIVYPDRDREGADSEDLLEGVFDDIANIRKAPASNGYEPIEQKLG